MAALERRQYWDSDGATRLIADPRWFPAALDRATGAIRLLDLGRERPNWRAIAQMQSGRQPAMYAALPAADAYRFACAGTAPTTLNIIWHTSYCCSTAIATALDVPGVNLCLYEPQILVDVAEARREAAQSGKGDPGWLSNAVLHLLARPHPGERSVLVKAPPAANGLIADAAARTGGNMLFLYCDCESFLRAVLRYGEGRRRAVRYLFNTSRSDPTFRWRWDERSLLALTDLEIAALAWQMQMSRFRGALGIHGPRAASLDCAAFLAAPKATVKALWRFFGLPTTADASPLCTDPAFLIRHAKFDGEAFCAQDQDKGLHPDMIADIARTAQASFALFPENRSPLPQALPLL
ncbi:MAG: hypothetical protein JO261_05520 [Alphaproteobacteria bacterium]|nr:hypothetical protein [Alphaproteobacteria bacterium]MBV9693141.1 hypothetical protein [Alphaproteobacteria bacterium]